MSTAVGDFPGLALMDLMKPYMPPTPENYERVLSDIHGRAIQMWAGCIWVPIYEVMTRKHLKLVTLEENLEMAADIGIDATTSLDEAFAEAMERHGAGREGDRPPLRPLPAAGEHGAAWTQSRSDSRTRPWPRPSARAATNRHASARKSHEAAQDTPRLSRLRSRRGRGGRRPHPIGWGLKKPWHHRPARLGLPV